MLDEATRRDIADRLWEAGRTRDPIEPISETHPDAEVTDAYEIQLLNVRRRVDEGARIRGHKVGISAKAVQRMLGVHEPDYGHLFDDMFVFEGDTVDTGTLIQPRAEIETAFVLGAPLAGPGVTVADVLRATEYLVPSIEIVDSRVADWRITIVDTIADNASCGLLVLGGRATPISEVDPALIGATLSVDGQIVETGASGAVLGNPVTAVAWLANKVADFGVTLDAGDVVLPGACTAMVDVRAGNTVRADFDGLGHVSVTFT